MRTLCAATTIIRQHLALKNSHHVATSTVQKRTHSNATVERMGVIAQRERETPHNRTKKGQIWIIALDHSGHPPRMIIQFLLFVQNTTQ